jgi:hypothetical protein
VIELAREREREGETQGESPSCPLLYRGATL